MAELPPFFLKFLVGICYYLFMHEFLFEGRAVVIFIQSWASPWWDYFFKGITGLGEEKFFFILFPILYWLVSKKVGLRVFIIFLLTAILNFDLKEFFKMPRPFTKEIFDSRIKSYYIIKNYAFPSGHALLSTVLWGYLAVKLRQGWFWLIAVLLVILVSLSRVYLGLHFPQDVLGGILIGILVLALVLIFEERLIRALKRLKLGLQLFLASLGPALFLMINFDMETLKISGVLGGALIGECLENKWIDFEVKRGAKNIVGRILVGGSVFFFLKFLQSLAPLNLWLIGGIYFSLGLGVTLIGPWLFKYFDF